MVVVMGVGVDRPGRLYLRKGTGGVLARVCG
jgi:hypothetical protein